MSTSRNSTATKSKSSVQVNKTNVVSGRNTVVGTNNGNNTRVPSRITVSTTSTRKDRESVTKSPSKSLATTTTKSTVVKTPSTKLVVRPPNKTMVSSKASASSPKMTTKTATNTTPSVNKKLTERRLSRVETKTATKSRSTLDKLLVNSNSLQIKSSSSSEKNGSKVEKSDILTVEKVSKPKTAKLTVISNVVSNVTERLMRNQNSNKEVLESKQNLISSIELEADSSIGNHGEITDDFDEVTEADYSDDFEDYESDFEDYESDDENMKKNDKINEETQFPRESCDSSKVELTRLVTTKLMEEKKIETGNQSADLEESSSKIRWEITLPPPTMKVENKDDGESSEKIKEIDSKKLDDNSIINYGSSEAINILQQLLGPKKCNQIAIQTTETSEISCQSDDVNLVHKSIQCPARSLSTSDYTRDKSTIIENIDILRLSHFLEIGEKITKNLISSKKFSHINIDGPLISTNTGPMYPPTIPNYRSEKTNSIISYQLPNDYKIFKINNIVTDNRYIYVVTNYGNTDEKLFTGTNGSVILIWNLLEPRACEYLLHSKFICTNVTTDNEFLIIASSLDGSLVVWDLREPFHQHSQLKSKLSINSDQPLRHPSFTSAVGKYTDYHQAPILQLFYRFEVNDDTEAKRIVSFDELSKIIVWLIVESYNDDYSTLQQVNDGLRPGSCVRLQISMVLNLSNSYIGNDEITITCIDCSPLDSWNYLIGTNYGPILRYSKYLENSPDPMEVIKYTYLSDEINHPVTCVSHHPNPESDLFLVGYMDGSVCLFSTKYQFPSRIWLPEDTGYSTIINTRWLSYETELFLILDQTKGITVRDVKGRGESLFEHQNGNDRTISIDISTINLDEYYLVYALEDSSIFGFNLSNHMSNA